MDVFDAIKGRRSCRNFLPDPVKEADMDKILEAGGFDPEKDVFMATGGSLNASGVGDGWAPCTALGIYRDLEPGAEGENLF